MTRFDVTDTVSCRWRGRMHDGEAASTRRTGEERAWTDERFKAEWKVWRGIKLLVVFRAANVTVVTPQQQIGLFYHF